MCCSKQIGTFRTAHNIIMSNKQPWRFLLYSWGILREPPHFCVDESVYNHPNNWPHFVPQKVTLTRSELSFFYLAKIKKRRWLWVSNGKKNSISNSIFFFHSKIFYLFPMDFIWTVLIIPDLFRHWFKCWLHLLLL